MVRFASTYTKQVFWLSLPSSSSYVEPVSHLYVQSVLSQKAQQAQILSSLVLECTNFALSVGFVFLRMCKLLIMAALYVGRIDTPFLAPGVGRVKPGRHGTG